MSRDIVQRGWCFECVFYHESAKVCQRFPPAPNTGAHSPKSTRWPVVNADDWCGEFFKEYTPAPDRENP